MELNSEDNFSLLIFNTLGERLIEISNYRNMQKIDISNFKKELKKITNYCSIL